MKKFVFALLVILSLLASNRAFAAEASICTKEEIAEILQGEGVEISNLRLVGMPEQFGKFSGAEDIAGFRHVGDGIVLSTGRAEGMFVPAYTFLSTSYCAYNRGGEFDIAYIEFDAVSDSSYISFQYIFASEEFDQPPMFNDLMRIEYKKNGESEYQNIALLPRSTEDICINNLRNTSYHYDNIVGEDIGYLGYTSLLSCQADVEAGETYHFIITIKDLGDPIYDSGLFIKAHSASNRPAPPPERNPDPPNRAPGSFQFSKEVADVKVTLSDGTVLQELNLEDGTSLHPESFTIIADDMIVVTVDDVILHGATLEVEYKFKLQNQTGDACIKYEIEDYKSPNYLYRGNQELLTENKLNADYGWRATQIEDDTVTNMDCGRELEPVIYPLQTIEKRVVFSKVLTPDLDEGDYVFENSAKATFTTLRDTIELEDEAVPVNILPPFGKQERSVQCSSSKFATILALAGMLFII